MTAIGSIVTGVLGIFALLDLWERWDTNVHVSPGMIVITVTLLTISAVLAIVDRLTGGD